MKITLKDGSSKEYSEAKSVYEIAKDISEGLARAACAGEVDGEIVDLRTVLDKDCTLNIITASDEEGLRVIRHTASHVLAQAVKNLFPDAKITIGPAIDDGFYYDFDSQPFSREDLDALEAEMKKIIKQGHEITRFTLPREEAIKFMKEKDGLSLSCSPDIFLFKILLMESFLAREGSFALVFVTMMADFCARGRASS